MINSFNLQEKNTNYIKISELKNSSPEQLLDEYQKLERQSSANKDYRIQKEFYIKQVNGNRMKSIIDGQQYAIFCSSPYDFERFWRFCYDDKISTIIALAHSDIYWPEQNQQLNFQKINLKVCCQKSQEISAGIFKKQLILKGSQEELILTHYMFTKWRDFGVPEGEESLQSFRLLINIALQCSQEKKKMIVHCMAGIGRTGTFGAVLEGIRTLKNNQDYSLGQILLNIRSYRSGSIETPKQYYFAKEQICRSL